MLVLSRKKNEVIRIGQDVSITVVELRGDKVRLGIDAPADIPVHRQEVFEAIEREEARAKLLEQQRQSQQPLPQQSQQPQHPLPNPVKGEEAA